MRSGLLARLQTHEDLPSLPDLVFRLRDMASDPDVPLSAIADLIRLEPVIAGRILAIANSVFYNPSGGKPPTLAGAVAKIGLSRLHQLVLSLTLAARLCALPVHDSRMFWVHSLAVACFTRHLGRRLRLDPREGEWAYYAGLMHDIGLLVFVAIAPDEYRRFVTETEGADDPVEICEQRWFGIDHAELGALYIARWWNMNGIVAEGVRHHHLPFRGDGDSRRVAQILNVANGVCNSQGMTNGLPFAARIFRDGAWEALGLSLDDVRMMLGEVRSSIGQARELIGLSEGIA